VSTPFGSRTHQMFGVRNMDGSGISRNAVESMPSKTPHRGALTPVLAATAERSVQPSNRAAQHRRRSRFWPPRNPATVEGPKNAGNSPFLHRSSRGAGARNRGEPKAGDRAAAISRDFGPPRTCQHRCIHFRGPGHLGPTHPFPRGRARAGEPSAGCSSVGDSQYLFDLL